MCPAPASRAPARSSTADRPHGQAGQRAQNRGHRVGNADPEIGVSFGEIARREAPHRKRPGLDQRAADHSLQRIGLGQDTHRHGQSIACPGDRFDVALGRIRPERFAQGRHMDGKSAVLDDDVGPELRPERLVRDQSAARLDQQYQDLPGLCGNGNVPAAARQPVLGRIKYEWTKRIGRHRILLYSRFLYSRFL